MKYAELVLKPEIQTALHEMGYEDLTPIQEEAIPHILENLSLIHI